MAALPDLAERQRIAQDTLAQIPHILESYPTKARESYFIDHLLSLDPCPHRERQLAEVSIHNADAYSVARSLLEQNDAAKGRIAVLNLASDERPAGGWETTLATTQEEALCYSSTLFYTLHQHFYPWPNTGLGSAAAVFSPQVIVFKTGLDEGCVPLSYDKHIAVSVISASAPRNPALVTGPNGKETYRDSNVLDDLRAKIRLIYRLAARENKNYLVLGAFGAGAYGNPPQLVAENMRDILLENEFAGYFDQVVFAIKSRKTNSEGSFSVFQTVFKGIKI
ncbi:hypothetical protein DL96DRAFT_1527695 [Flagelloscypha sp. PMI_526]|nr:hypothetical protein DL96DRAFT_1527695 [Flagelloscypha sp. PMI_526]